MVSIGSALPSQSSVFSIYNAFFVPQLSLSLLSISQLSDPGFGVVFSSSSCVVQDQSPGSRLGPGVDMATYISWSVYIFPWSIVLPILSPFHLSESSSAFYLWHSRLGHLSSERLKGLVSSGALGNVST